MLGGHAMKPIHWFFMTRSRPAGEGRESSLHGCIPEPDLIFYVLGNHFPQAFCRLADKWLMDAFKPGSHGSTFGGSPLAIMTVIASLIEIQRQKITERAQELGTYAFIRLKELEKRSPHIKEVRGTGLMTDIEVIKGEKSCYDFSNDLIKEGLIVKETHDRVIRFSPPLICTKKEIDHAMKCFEKVFLK